MPRRCWEHCVYAARARDRLALERHGQYTWLNLPDEWPPEKRQALYAEAKADHPLPTRISRIHAGLVLNPCVRVFFATEDTETTESQMEPDAGGFRFCHSCESRSPS